MPFRIRILSPPLAGLLCVLAVASTAHAPRPVRAQSLQDDPFAVPVGLESAVEFWKKVYGEWSQDEVTFHDRDDLDIVYRRMNQKKSETPSGYAANEAAQQAIVDHYRRILLDLATRNPDPRTLSGEYAEVHALFGARGNPDRWRRAADRIRVQRGLREHFQRGLIHAGQFREHILEIFREEGIPEEIAWLPMVESTFNVEARSKVGAAGVWQFMPGTGRLYMRVDATVDERLDPILAARGAARLLKQNYQGLRSWPLALTAYNHGYYGMRRAVAQVGTNDYMTIRRLYDGPAFGFASKNFFAEFLAAIDVAEHAEQYFGLHEPFRTLEFDVVPMPVAMSLRDVASAVQVDADRLWKLNPSLTDDVWAGRRSVPAGFALRVPPGYGREAPLQLAASAASHGARTVRAAPGTDPTPRVHTVQRGDTLTSIAVRYGLSVGELIALNGLDDRDVIQVGQKLVIAK
ncbi:MAG TPA: transglycosylase SLT domain-containing protein [Gemmatimonadota bacterium]